MSTPLRRSGVYADVDGERFLATTLTDGGIVLLSDAPVAPPGFDPVPTGPPWSRTVTSVDVDRLVEITTTATWRGHEFDLANTLPDGRVLLAYTGPDRAWADANLHTVEPGWWDATIPAAELDSVREDVTERPR